jgi:hypothetical protein
MQLQNLWSTHRGLVIIAILGCIAIVVTICSVCRITPLVGRVTNLGVCQGIGSKNEPVGISDTFPTSSKRIYAYFTLDSATSIRLIVRWYHEDKLILERQDPFGPGLNYTWIERQNSVDFEEGTYKLDVAGHTIQFRIKKAE